MFSCLIHIFIIDLLATYPNLQAEKKMERIDTNYITCSWKQLDTVWK